MSEKMRGRGQHSSNWGFEFPSEGQGVSYDLCRVLNKLFYKGKMGEGKLAGLLGWQIWRPEWKRVIDTLLEWGLIKEESSTHGRARELFLSETDGKEFVEQWLGYASVQEQAKAEILAAGKPLDDDLRKPEETQQAWRERTDR